MTKKEKESLILEIKNLQMEMKDACGETVREEELPQMYVDSGDIYEVVATIKLSTGDSFTIHNHCFDSFIKGKYSGDEIHVVDDLLVIGIFDNRGNYRSIKSPISNVCILDAYSVGINWGYLWNDFIAKHPGFKLPKRSNYDSNPMEDLTAMIKEVNDRFGFRLLSPHTSPYPKGLSITSNLPFAIPNPEVSHLSDGSKKGDKEK